MLKIQMDMSTTLAKLISIIGEISETETDSLTSKTDYINSDFYDSLFTLSLIAAVDETFNVVLTGNDVQSSKSIEILSEIIEAKKCQ